MPLPLINKAAWPWARRSGITYVLKELYETPMRRKASRQTLQTGAAVQGFGPLLHSLMIIPDATAAQRAGTHVAQGIGFREKFTNGFSVRLGSRPLVVAKIRFT